MLEQLYQGLYNDGSFTGSFEDFQRKMQNPEYRKKLHAGIVDDGDFTGDFTTFETKFKPADTEWYTDAEWYTEQTGIEKQNESFWENPLGWWQIEEDETQEKNTWIEDWFSPGDNTKNQLTDFLGDRWRDLKRGWSGQENIEDFINVYSEEGAANITQEEFDNMWTAMEQQAKGGVSDEMLEFMREVNKPGSKTFNWVDKLSSATILENPSIITEVALSSMAGMASALVNSGDVRVEALEWGAKGGIAGAGVGAGVGAAIGAWSGPGAAITAAAGAKQGAIRGFLGGLFGGVSKSIETAQTFGEQLRKEVVAQNLEWNEENAKKVLNMPGVFERIKNKGLARGNTVGAIETMANMIAPGAGSLTLKAGGSKFLAGAAVLGVEGLGGAYGEYRGSKVIGETTTSKELWLEALGEFGTSGPVNVYQALKNPPSYKIGGKKASRKDMQSFLTDKNLSDAEIANAEIEIKNHPELEKLLQIRQAKAYLRTQVDERVGKQEDIDAIVDLELRLRNIDTKSQSGKNKASEIKTEINEILDRYADVDRRTSDVKARKKVAGEVRKEKRRVFLKATEKFAEISSEQLDFDPYEAFDNNDDYVSAFVERSMMGMDLSKMSQQEIEAEANRLADEANNTDGVNIISAADGSTKIMINREVAAEYGVMNVGSHEVLHGVMEGALNQLENLDIEDAKKRKAEGKKAIATKDTRVGKLISEFKGQIKTNLGQDVVDLIEKRLREDYGMSKEQMATTSEWFNVLSDIVENEKNNITYEGNKGFWNSIKDNVAGIFNKHTPYEKLSIETGEQAFNFMKEYSKSVKAGKLSESMVAFAKGKPQPTKDKADFSITSPRAQQFLDAEIDNKSLVDIEQSKQSTPEDRFAAVEAVIEKNWPVISNALKFNPTGNIPMQAIKEAINEQILGIFPQVTLQDGTKISRKTPLFDTYNKETEVTTFLSATLKPRQPEIFARAKAIGGIEQIGVDISEAKDIKAPEPTKQKPGKKVRKIKNLSEVNLDNKDVISQTIFNKITNILEQNPKNLTKQLTALIEKDFMKAVKEGMGKISLKAKENEVIVSEEYKTYHALNYENHVKALDVNTIKKNYKTLFDIKKIGREKDKRVNPETGVVTYPGKGIYDIKTNKAKFTKFFIDTSSLDKKTGKPLSARSHYNKILARQKKLAELIAASITKGAVNKFKKENSNDISTIVEAEIDSFLDTMEKQKGENKTFDTVNYSRSKVEKGMGLLIHEGIGDSINSNIAKKIIYKYKLDPSMVKKAKQVIDKSKAQFSNSIKTEFPKETADAGVIKQIRNAIKRVWSASVPKEETYKETYDPKTGETVGKNVEIRMVERLWNEELGITWGERMAKPLNNFLDKHPQYYMLLRELLTGGDRAVFMNVDRFEQFIPETKKIRNTDQVLNKRVKIHRNLTEDEKKAGLKDKRLIDPKKWNFEKTNEKDKFKNFVRFFKDLSVWLNADQNKIHTWIMEELVIHSSVDQNNFFRKGAVPYAYQIDENNKPITDQAVVEEHTPINEIVKIAMDAAIRGNVKEVEVVLRALLGQASILKINDPSGNLQGSLGVDFYEKVLPKIVKGILKLKDGHAGIYRLMKHGIDPFTIELYESGNNIAEEFSVSHLSPSEARQDIINQFEKGKVRYSKANTKKSPLSKDIHKRKTISKASNFSRSSKNKTQGMSAWDFDDTVARTKSGVRYTMPNPEGIPQPSRKVIFLAGGAGSGKSNVVKQLGLVDQGFKVVNQDISLEWLKKNSGLPADMKDLTPKQLSQLGKLQWEARKIAARKQMKFQGKGDGIVVDGTGGSMKVMEKQVQEFRDKGYDVQMLFVETSLETALARNAARKERTLRKSIVKRNHEAVQNNKEGFRKLFGNNFAEVKTDNLKIGDSMPSSLVNKLDKFTKGYIKGRLTAEEFATEGSNVLEQKGEFDFTEFDVVTRGEKGPLFGKAMGRAKKYGLKDNYILTARPHAAKKPIYEFLKSQGLEIPLDNIITLENSTSEAKALWIAEKVGEGYNDIYFADDALQNVQAVQNMLDQFDVKGKTQQAKIKFSKSINQEFNNILEDVTGIESKKRFSAIKARKRGESKGKFRFFIPPSHEDFVGLLYNFMGKGKKGNQHRDFFEQALIRPLNRAYRELNTAKQSIANDYKSLNKEFENVKKKLTKKTPDGDFTYQDAIRVYLFDKHGHKVPGLTKTDQQKLVDLVMGNPELQTYAETLNVISKQDAYVNPTESWEAGDIRTDLDDATGRVGREQFFTEFFENTDIIFSQENLNKIEAAYGEGVVSAIKDILYRTKTGRNRPSGQNKLVNKFLNYLNGSVASTMFFNIRSAVLQQMSMVNFINFADNNIFKAAKAFANQKQYWADWATIFNSDFMKQRRKGIKTDVNGAELAATVKDAKNPIQAAIKKLLELGFLPTQIGDNIAIATGGATYYRNKINTYLKQGLSKKEAESKAWTDFQVLAEATQQSARPDMVSQQQASPLGKVILAFQNVTSQFNRLGKKAFLDIKNRRISPEYKNAKNPQLQSDISNLSRIGYYFAMQNLIFYSLQSALFMAMFDDDDEDERWLKKKERVVNGSIDSVLRGTGVWGAAVSTLKNMAIKWHEQREKGYNADESAVLMEMLNVSPPLGIKARKLVNAEKTLNYNKKVIDEMETFDIDNPQWSAVTNYVEATTNVPLNRLYNKTQNVRASLDNQHNAFERALMFSGWSQWNLGIEAEKKEKKKKTKRKSLQLINTW